MAVHRQRSPRRRKRLMKPHTPDKQASWLTADRRCREAKPPYMMMMMMVVVVMMRE